MKKAIKMTAVILCAVFYLQMFYVIAPTLKANAIESTDELFASGVWALEDNANFTATAPSAEDGVWKFDKGDSVRFLWQEIDGFAFDSSKTYTLQFDVKVTDKGDNTGNATGKREMYLGGSTEHFFAVMQSSSNAQALRAGNNNFDADHVCQTESYDANTVYTVTMEWDPTAAKPVMTIKNGDSVIVKGFRTQSSSNYGTAEKTCSSFVLRCEDGAIEVDNFSFTDGTNTYSEDFTTPVYTSTEKLFESGLWDLESDSYTKPTVENDVWKFTEGNSVKFKWQEIDGITFDSSKTYTLQFDVKVTKALTQTGNRELFFGAFYNNTDHFQIWIKSDDSSQALRTGNKAFTEGDYSAYKNQSGKSAFKLNTVYTAKMVWEPSENLVTLSLRDGEDIVVAGYRSMTAYANANTYFKELVFRCEDGAIEIDNLSFTDGTVTYAEEFNSNDSEPEEEPVIPAVTTSTDIELPENKSAVYTCTFTHTDSGDTSLTVDGETAFILSEGTMRILGAQVYGSYTAGTYTVKVTLNPLQKMARVEVTLPEGGKVRRGSFQLIDAAATEFKVETSSIGENSATVSDVTFTDVLLNDYTLISTEPEYLGFDANVYNLITSFSDAATTRAFAWTALASFIGDKEMAVRYRAVGSDEWSTVDAVREVEGTVIEVEDYFKADITGLKPETEYEYRIGVKDSADEENDWGRTYTFKTAAGNEKEFTFVALGDTQGKAWDGNTAENTGFMYAEAAYTEALQTVSDPAFILHTGDVVQDGFNPDQWNWFFKATGDHVKSTPHFAAIGNHDVLNANLSGDKDNGVEFYFDLHFNHPNNGGTAAIDREIADTITNENVYAISKDADETVYSYNYGDAHFIVLNTGSNSIRYDALLLQAQREWLIADLEANADAKWTIVMLHEPDYYFSGGDKSRSALRNVIEDYGVDLVIEGHSHLVSRTYPMKDGKIVSKSAIDVIEQGSGIVFTTIGATSNNHDKLVSSTIDYNVEECAVIMSPAYEEAAYSTVTVSEDKLVMTIRQLNGMVLDSFTITADTEGKTAEKPLTIAKTDETVSGKSDGVISGLTTDMEYRTENGTYMKVTASSVTVAPGTYYVRYAVTETSFASAPVRVVIAKGRNLGDSNFDGVLDATDLSYLRGCLLRASDLAVYLDLDENGDIDIKDLVLLKLSAMN